MSAGPIEYVLPALCRITYPDADNVLNTFRQVALLRSSSRAISDSVKDRSERSARNSRMAKPRSIAGED